MQHALVLSRGGQRVRAHINADTRRHAVKANQFAARTDTVSAAAAKYVRIARMVVASVVFVTFIVIFVALVIVRVVLVLIVAVRVPQESGRARMQQRNDRSTIAIVRTAITRLVAARADKSQWRRSPLSSSPLLLRSGEQQSTTCANVRQVIGRRNTWVDQTIN